MKVVRIGTRKIGGKNPCFIIAEAGVNHNGDPDLAKKLIDEAHRAGADAVKFQTFVAEKLVTRGAGKAEYQKKNDSTTKTQYQMLKNLELSEDDFIELAAHAKKKRIVFLSSAFDEESLDLLIRLDVRAFKIPSGEITNFPLMEKLAGQEKPVILSTGMSGLDEVSDAVSFLKDQGCSDLILLHCTTSYPAPLESVNLQVMDTLRDHFHLPVGYSDHTQGILVPVIAVARGARVIEKHFTLDRSLPGPDHPASLEPDEFTRMVRAIRDTESAIGSGKKTIQTCEIAIRDAVRKSIVAATRIPRGSVITGDMLTIKRPGNGIEPKFFRDIAGKTAVCAIKKDAVITWDMIQ